MCGRNGLASPEASGSKYIQSRTNETMVGLASPEASGSKYIYAKPSFKRTKSSLS